MSIVEFLSQPFWQRLGLTLVHFLWQGLAVAVLVGVFVRVFRLKHGNARYAAYLLAFIAMIACPAITFIAIDITISPNTELVTGAESTEVFDSSPSTALSAGDILPEAETFRPAIPTLADSIPLGQRISDWLNVSMPWVLVIWMVGVVVLSVRLFMGFVGVYRWRHRLEPLPERLAQRIVSLSEGLGLRRFSQVFISPSVLQAVAVGYLRPMVLLPAAMVTQIQPEMLEAVLAHELAHIRRFDLWVNLIQRVTETLLFYHPAVWWLSFCLRSERELCCDELAVKATGQRLTYATTLESIGRARFMAKQLILAAGLGQDKKLTLSRVRHILGLTPPQRNCPFWLAGVITVLFLAALVIPTTLALTNQSDGKLKHFESVVVEGIRANRDKFKCGYLVWSSKYINNIEYNGRPAIELAGEYELWWDGKKIATKYVRDQLYKDPEGNFRIEKQQGGNSYDGGFLSRKPDFHSENWLGPGVTRWRGQGSRDWQILEESHLNHITKDWSVIDANGAKFIRAITRNMNETARDYEAYSIRDYDPSKGYGLVNEEWYNPDGSQRLKHTVKMLEVIPGGWFPVEVDSKSFAITDGKEYKHNHCALDIERCSFNDRSALPDRIFKGAVDQQLKYQERLQKYLAMELEGISDVKEAVKAYRVKRGAREAIEKYVAAAMAGDFETGRQFAGPDKAPYDQIEDLHEVAKEQNLWIMVVVADDFSAIAVSSVIFGDHERVGPLVFFLDRKPQDGRDDWWVDDIDMETPDGAKVELKQFLEKHPKAKKVPYDNKPAVQIDITDLHGIAGSKPPSIRLPTSAEDIADILSKELYAEGDLNKRYFLIGPKKDIDSPARGFRLLIVLPGGDGSANFHPFIKRIFKNALSEEYIVAQPIAVQWGREQFKNVVWPTRTHAWPSMKFSTEEFVESVIRDIKRKYKLDERHVFTLGWSSGGPPCYAIALQESTVVKGSLIAMSVFHREWLPPLDTAKGHIYYLLHSPEDKVCPFNHAEQAETQLSQAGAKVHLGSYGGGHGWHGDVYGNIHAGIQWLQKAVQSGQTGVQVEVENEQEIGLKKPISLNSISLHSEIYECSVTKRIGVSVFRKVPYILRKNACYVDRKRIGIVIRKPYRQ